MILLDMNALSQLMVPSPPLVGEAWISRHPAVGIFVSAIMEAELQYDLALSRSATLATRNAKDLEDYSITLVDTWSVN